MTMAGVQNWKRTYPGLAENGPCGKLAVLVRLRMSFQNLDSLKVHYWCLLGVFTKFEASVLRREWYRKGRKALDGLGMSLRQNMGDVRAKIAPSVLWHLHGGSVTWTGPPAVTLICLQVGDPWNHKVRISPMRGLMWGATRLGKERTCFDCGASWVAWQHSDGMPSGNIDHFCSSVWRFCI